MRKLWTDPAWDDYHWWQKNDRKMLKRVNDLIKDVERDPFSGKGKPEALKHNLSGYWSRRIDQEHRLIYKVLEDDLLLIVHCRYHYSV